jgi:hypothetical protein
VSKKEKKEKKRDKKEVETEKGKRLAFILSTNEQVRESEE